MIRDLITRRELNAGIAGAIAVPLAATPARAQASYPSRPVRLILPFGAAGVADITARLAAEKLADKLGQRVVVENQPGPGGIVAARAVLSQPPDGHTLALVSNGTAISVAIYKSLPFDPVKQFAPISTIGTFDLVFATNAAAGPASLRDVMEAARREPGKLNLGTIAVGSTQNLGAELFKSAAALDIQLVPYRGTPEVIVALLRSDIGMMIDFYAAMKPALLEHKITPVAVSGLRRSPFLPEVPTVAEAGLPGYEVTSWNAVAVRAGTPAAIVSLLNSALHEVVALPEVKERYAELGIEAQASTPEELKARLEADIAKWSALIERAGIAKL